MSVRTDRKELERRLEQARRMAKQPFDVLTRSGLNNWSAIWRSSYGDAAMARLTSLIALLIIGWALLKP